MRILVRNILVLLFLLSAKNSLAQVRIEQSVDSVEILVGEQTQLKLNATVPKGHRLQWPMLKERQYVVPGLEVVKSIPADTIHDDGALLTIEKKYTLTSFNEHLFAIPPLTVKVNGKPYKGTACALKVISIDVDTLHPNQFFPPKDVQDNPFMWSEVAPYFWLSLLIVILFVFAFYLLVRLRQNKPIITKIRVIKHIPPHQKALTSIGQIKEEHMQASEDQKTYYTRLTDALRQYIQERFGFNAKEMTSNEIIACLQESGDKTMIDELRELFSTADLVKFAKYSTLLNENDLNLVNAIDFIDKTKQEGQAVEERIVPNLSDDDKRTQQNRITIKALLWTLGLIIFGLLVYVVYNFYLLSI